MNEAYRQAFGKVIKGLRKAQGLSVLKFSLMVNVSRPTIYRIERGEANFKFDALIKITDGLGLTIPEVFLMCDKLLSEENPAWRTVSLPNENNRFYAYISLPNRKQLEAPPENSPSATPDRAAN